MKMKKTLALITSTLLVGGALLTGCGNSAQPNSTASTGSPLVGSKNEKYVMVTFVSGIEYWKGAYSGMQDAAKNLGVTTEYTGATDYDINQEVTVLDQVIAQKPAGILLTCINPDA
jgi:ribose transport system substrate-binding protein